MSTHLQFVYAQVIFHFTIKNQINSKTPKKKNSFTDSYIGMDQQLDLKLDVKEAAAIPTEHPQWDISESESEQNEQHGNESEFTTDSSGEEDN